MRDDTTHLHTMRRLAESTVEEATLVWFHELGYDYRPGPESTHDGLFAERKGYEDIALGAGLQSAPERLNPGLPPAIATPMEPKA